jgi:formylglycine-generating enzyme required for sulfatase activity
MPGYPVIDITALAVVGEQFPLRLMQLGFRLMQVVDAAGQDQVQYMVPPVCLVPAGTFTMGSDKQHDPQAYDREVPQYDIFVPAFHLGTYPLTVAEYACAVRAGEVKEPQTSGNVTWQAQQQHPDHPVVCITWHEAKAYTAWLAKLTGKLWRLPTEAEWEKAARGTDGRIYPWGNQWEKVRANTAYGGPRTTTPIGNYADKGDASPYHVHDMAGNVWEWTSSIYQERPPYRAEQAEKDADTTSNRVLRGGAWDYIPLNARAACRGSNHPTSFSGDFGGRLVVSAAAGTR